MFKHCILLVLFASTFLQAQNYPPDWSANGWLFSGWNGSSLDSSYTLTYVQDSSATQGSFSQFFSSGGETRFFGNNYNLFNIYWRKSFSVTDNPIGFLFDFKIKNIDSIKNVYLKFTYGGHFSWWSENRIYNNFEIGQWKTIQVNVLNPPGNQFDFIEFELGFQTSSAQTMHFKYLIDNLRLVYSDTTILFDDFGDGMTNIYDGFYLSEVNQYSLSQNYPNPFNPKTIISFTIPKDEFVELKIYDLLGNEIAVLVNEYKLAGKTTLEFDASNLSSGVYFYRIKVNDFIQTKKILLAK